MISALEINLNPTPKSSCFRTPCINEDIINFLNSNQPFYTRRNSDTELFDIKYYQIKSKTLNKQTTISSETPVFSNARRRFELFNVIDYCNLQNSEKDEIIDSLLVQLDEKTRESSNMKMTQIDLEEQLAKMIEQNQQARNEMVYYDPSLLSSIENQQLENQEILSHSYMNSLPDEIDAKNIKIDPPVMSEDEVTEKSEMTESQSSISTSIPSSLPPKHFSSSKSTKPKRKYKPVHNINQNEIEKPLDMNNNPQSYFQSRKNRQKSMDIINRTRKSAQLGHINSNLERANANLANQKLPGSQKMPVSSTSSNSSNLGAKLNSVSSESNTNISNSNASAQISSFNAHANNYHDNTNLLVQHNNNSNTGVSKLSLPAQKSSSISSQPSSEHHPRHSQTLGYIKPQQLMPEFNRTRSKTQLKKMKSKDQVNKKKREHTKDKIEITAFRQKYDSNQSPVKKLENKRRRDFFTPEGGTVFNRSKTFTDIGEM